MCVVFGGFTPIAASSAICRSNATTSRPVQPAMMSLSIRSSSSSLVSATGFPSRCPALPSAVRWIMGEQIPFALLHFDHIGWLMRVAVGAKGNRTFQGGEVLHFSELVANGGALCGKVVGIAG